MDWLEPLRKDTERIRQENIEIRKETEKLRQTNIELKKATEKLRELDNKKLKEIVEKSTIQHKK